MEFLVADSAVDLATSDLNSNVLIAPSVQLANDFGGDGIGAFLVGILNIDHAIPNLEHDLGVVVVIGNDGVAGINVGGGLCRRSQRW